MSNRKSQSRAVGYEPPKPESTPDHLAGKHFENYLYYPDKPCVGHVTPLSAAINAPAEPEWERRDDAFIRSIYGEEEVQRRIWQENNEPGGKTFRPGKR